MFYQRVYRSNATSYVHGDGRGSRALGRGARPQLVTLLYSLPEISTENLQSLNLLVVSKILP